MNLHIAQIQQLIGKAITKTLLACCIKMKVICFQYHSLPASRSYSLKHSQG
jgi:hypothetical protein